MNIYISLETEKAKDQQIRYGLPMTGNKKYVKCGQALIIRDDPQRYEEMAGANRNKAGAPFRYAESLFAALSVVKSTTGLPCMHLQGRLIETLSDEDSPCYTTIHRRFQALDVKRHDGVFAVTGGGTVPFILHIVNTSL